MLKMENVSKIYRTNLIETHALRKVDLHIGAGEFVSVTGPSGSGKTTFLNLAGLLETFEEGDFYLDGQNVKGLNDNQLSELRNEKIGFIFQSFNLLPELPLFDNVDVPLRYRGFNAKERKERIENALEIVGLSSRMQHLPTQLSGGQQQRLAIARALAMEPTYMLFDEATSALDPELVGEVLDAMRLLAQEGMTMICVTHEMGFARDVSDRVAVVHEGIIEEIDTPTEIFGAPKSDLLKKFLSNIR